MEIPDITNDQVLVCVLDELRFRLKARTIGATPLTEDFVHVLDGFLSKHGLDQDQHDFAKEPGRGETALPRIPPGHDGAGNINNCNLAHWASQAECQMCDGICPDREYFASRRLG